MDSRCLFARFLECAVKEQAAEQTGLSAGDGWKVGLGKVMT